MQGNIRANVFLSDSMPEKLMKMMEMSGFCSSDAFQPPEKFSTNAADFSKRK